MRHLRLNHKKDSRETVGESGDHRSTSITNLLQMSTNYKKINFTSPPYHNNRVLMNVREAKTLNS